MIIQILPSLKDAQKAKGVTVVIDVLRAFTTVCYLFSNGAKKVLPVADLSEAYKLKKVNPSYPLIGERKGIKPPDFDWGNSPAELKRISFDKKTVIFTTSAGTQGIHKCIHADEIITGAFVNANAIVSYLHDRNPAMISLLCTDDSYPENEDILCATYLRSLLQGNPISFYEIQTYMKSHPAADHFIVHPMTKWSKKDYDLCMTRDTFNFVIRANKGNPVTLERL